VCNAIRLVCMAWHGMAWHGMAMVLCSRLQTARLWLADGHLAKLHITTHTQNKVISPIAIFDKVSQKKGLNRVL